MAGWTAPRTWADGPPPVTAAQLNQHLRDNLLALNGFVLKGADESRTSNPTLTNDAALAYTIGAVGTYLFDLTLFATAAAAAGDISVGFAFPTGTCHFTGMSNDPSLASGSSGTGEWLARLSATSGGNVISYGLSAAVTGLTVRGILIATATGTLQTMWAQQTSNASASTVKAGSFMTVRQVA